MKSNVFARYQGSRDTKGDELYLKRVGFIDIVGLGAFIRIFQVPEREGGCPCENIMR